MQILDSTISLEEQIKPRRRTSREDGGAVGSLSRGLILLDVLTRASAPLTLSELAAEAGLDVSTAHRLLQILLEQGYAVRDDSTKRYLPGPRALSPLSLFHPITQLKNEARSVLEFLRERTSETTALVLFIGKERMVVDFVRGDHPLSPYYDTWLKSPLHGSASGKILLASLPPAERDQLLGPAPYKSFTSETITKQGALFSYLDIVREQGFAVARDDAYEGMTAIGAALMPYPDGRPIGCLVVTASSPAVTTAREKEIADRLKAASQLLISSAPSVQILKTWTGRTML
ncbi:IclR family transcriptional regulator [Lacisediminimonas profundi]|uniref:IclR family transcriptional regulator n=1 Tax=Lacisediminimonas profundi TaxID=2603856 RepID=UPI00124B7607|nr:IclR family transcriptional regulator [Lacisediminimonas profundi]